MENLNLDLYDYKKLKKGDVVEGTVVEIKNDKTIFIDINSYTEGTMYLEYFTKDKNVTSFKGLVKVGDKLLCTVTKVSEDNIYLSRLNQINDEAVKGLVKAKDEEETIVVKITEEMEKGYKASYNGVNSLFLPKSLASDVTVGKTYEVKVIDGEAQRGNFVISRRAITDIEFKENKDKEYDSIKQGDVLKGTITKVEKYGALVKFNYVTGLLKTNQVAHEYIDIEKVLHVGDEIEVKVVKKENGKLELSRKALIESPFNLYIKEHKVSDTVKGRLTNKLQFGLLLELAPNVKGLLHQSEYSHNPNDNFANCVKINDEIEASIIKIDAENEKISLSRKPLLDNPWERVEAKVGDIVDVKVTEVNEKGLKVEALGVDGIVPFSEAADEKGSLDQYQKDDVCKAIITELKPREWRLKLSINKFKRMEERKDFEGHLTEDVEDVTIGDRFKDVLESK